MADYEESFPPEAVDEQIEQPMFLPSEDARLVEALRQVYQPDAHKNAQSLDQAWQRIQQLQAQALASQHIHSQPVLTIQNKLPQKRNIPMNTTSSRSGRSRSFSLLLSIAAVAFVALLVGSMALIFAMARNTGKGTAPAHQNTAVITQTTAPTPGMYTTSRKDQNTSQIKRLDKNGRKAIWTYDTGPSPSSVIVIGNTVYFTDSEGPELNDNYVYALNATSGVLRWRSDLVSHFVQPTPTPIVFHGTPIPHSPGGSPMLIYPGVLTTPAATGDAVYVIARDGMVYALSSSNGQTLWTYNTKLIASVDGTIYDQGDVAIANGIVYVTIHNGLFALDAKSGSLQWSKQTTETQVFASPQVVDGSVYLSSSEVSHHSSGQSQSGAIYAYDAKSGKLYWKHPVDNWVSSSPTVVKGIVYFASFDTNVYALQASNGSEVWHYSTKGQVFSLLVDNGVVYAQEEGNGTEAAGQTNTVKPALFAIDAAKGAKLWSQQIKASLLAIQGGILYISKDQGFYALKASDGSTIWSRPYANNSGQSNGEVFQITVIP